MAVFCTLRCVDVCASLLQVCKHFLDLLLLHSCSCYLQTPHFYRILWQHFTSSVASFKSCTSTTTLSSYPKYQAALFCSFPMCLYWRHQYTSSLYPTLHIFQSEKAKNEDNSSARTQDLVKHNIPASCSCFICQLCLYDKSCRLLRRHWRSGPNI